MDKGQLVKLIKLAIDEDVGTGDITSEAIVPNGHMSEGSVIAKESGAFAGIDVFDVAQTSARDMSLPDLYNMYGSKVCIHGAIDSQRYLVNGNPQEIKKEVKKAKHLWGKKGGIVLAPSHLITPDTPIKNVLALYEALKE